MEPPDASGLKVRVISPPEKPLRAPEAPEPPAQEAQPQADVPERPRKTVEDFLKPELQDEAIYADSYEFITQTDKGVASNYIADGTVEGACPPLKALLHIMAEGSYNGMTQYSPEFRDMFKPENVLNSDWYKERLAMRQTVEANKLKKNLAYLKENMTIKPKIADQIAKTIKETEEELAYVESPQYLVDIDGSIGTDPYLYKLHH